jgi:hypothetical protein
MTDSTEPDLTVCEQGDLFGAEPPRDYRPDPEQVRAQLRLVLDCARAAPARPWSRRDMEFYRVVFPQMTNWLPEDEANQLCFEFETELARLEAA